MEDNTQKWGRPKGICFEVLEACFVCVNACCDILCKLLQIPVSTTTYKPSGNICVEVRQKNESVLNLEQRESYWREKVK